MPTMYYDDASGWTACTEGKTVKQVLEDLRDDGRILVHSDRTIRTPGLSVRTVVGDCDGKIFVLVGAV